MISRIICSATVAGEPLPAPRPRFRRGGKAYYPKEYIGYRGRVAFALKANLRNPMSASPSSSKIGLRAIFFSAKKRPGDVDNLLKAILDSGIGVVWIDDSQVRKVSVRIEEDKENPRVELLIYELEEEGVREVKEIS